MARRASVGFGPCGGEPTCGGGVVGWGATTFRVGTFVVVSDVCVFGRRRRGAYRWDRVGCTRGNGAHPWREVTPSRGWRHGRSDPRLRTTASARRGGLNSGVYSRERLPTLTVSGQSDIQPFGTQERFQCALFYPSQILDSVFSHQIIARNAPLLPCRSCHLVERLRRGQSVRRVCGDPETCGLLRRNSRCRECTRA